MNTYLISYRWRYEPLDQMESYNYDNNSQKPIWVSWLTYHALFPSELIIKSDLQGEELYNFIRAEIEKKEKDPKHKQTYYIDNIIKL